jgi:hypothetical protein
MDPFVVPRTTFIWSLKLVQFPFEVGLRLLGGGDDDPVEATADRADADVVEKPRRRQAQRRRQTAAKSKGQAAKRSGQTTSRRGQAGNSRQRQTSRRGQTPRQTAARRRQATERATAATARSEPATEQREAATAHSETETLRALQDVQERIEAARGQVGAGQRETPEQRPPEAGALDEARDETATQERREHDAERPGAQAENAESAHES